MNYAINRRRAASGVGLFFYHDEPALFTADYAAIMELFVSAGIIH